MVLLTIHVRPKNGYSFPGKIKTLSVDSSKRLEDVVADLKLDTKKGITLFSSQGRLELALNTSLASNNVQNFDIIETCSSPLLSAALSAVLEDLNQVGKLAEDERSQDRIEPLLGLTTNRLEPSWPNRWNHDSLKSRIISLAFLKKVIQRHDRFSHLVVPQCQNLLSFYEFLQESVFTSASERRSSSAQIVKPLTKEGYPTTCWQLLQFKLDQISSLQSSASAGNGGEFSCPIERFLALERERHGTLNEIYSPSQQLTTPVGRRKDPPPGSSRSVNSSGARKRRRIATDSPSVRLADKEWKCFSCKAAPATCMCLTEACPFEKKPSCQACFRADHPIIQRNHDNIAFTDARVKNILKAMHRQDRQNLYCPEYASGPFAILCTLYDQSVNYNQFSLSESRLKELAQLICRSNLYDHQARGRNAFACIEGLMERNLVRMELLNRSDQEGMYSLLPEGETLARCCFAFEEAVKAVVHQNPKILLSKKDALNLDTTGNMNNNTNPVSITVDTREDGTYADRLIHRCRQESISAEKKELPAGDYLFLVGDRVCPIIVERKSWSDLADSVLGKGKRRLDCVRVGDDNVGACKSGRCQLCKMKASGCTKIMFIVEGARCANLGATSNKCTETKRCQFCRELQQRHGQTVVQEALEEVLHNLQINHGCFVHYTRSYNETIDSLIQMRDILGSGVAPTRSQNVTGGGNGADDDMAKAIALSLGKSHTTLSRTSQSFPFAEPLLTYEQFCSNARRKLKENNSSGIRTLSRGQLQELDDRKLIQHIFDGSIGVYCEGLDDEAVTLNAKRTLLGRAGHKPNEIVDLNESFKDAVDADNESDSDIEVIEEYGVPQLGKAKAPTDSIIVIDGEEEEDPLNESQESVQIIDFPVRNSSFASRKRGRCDSEGDDEIEVCLASKHSKEASQRTDTGKLKSNRKRSNRGIHPPLLIIHGLCEFDRELYKDMSAVWKDVYQRDKLSSSVGDVFRSSCREEIRKIQNTQSPFVDRKSLSFWLLYIQLKCDVQVHVMRQHSCRQRLESQWNKRRNGTIPSTACAATSQSVQEPRRAKRARRGVPPQPEVHLKCIICAGNLGTRNLEVTPCAHSFHFRCLHDWLSSQSANNRLCPMCKHPLGALKDDSRFVAEKSTPKSRNTRTPPTRDSATQSIREARLARFERGNPSAKSTIGGRRENPVVHASFVPAVLSSTATYQEEDDWNCAKCTLRNKMLDASCGACGSTRPGRTHWICRICTLKNQLGVSTCSACQTLNPDCLKSSVGNRNVKHISIDADDRLPLSVASAPTSASRADTATAMTSSSKPSKAKCGACGEVGHNRASANPDNCYKYYDENEVARRKKKKDDNKRKAQQAREEIAQLERNGQERNTQLRDAQRALALLEQAVGDDEAMRESVVKTLKKKKARAEKQARKYD